MSLGPASLPSIITMLFNLLIGLLVYRRNPTSRSALAFLLLTSTFALWLGSAAAQRASDGSQAIFWNQLQYAGASLIIVTFTLFTHEFLIDGRTILDERYLRWTIYAIGFGLAILSFSGLLITNDVRTGTYEILGSSYTVYYGAFGPLYTAFVVGFVLAIILNIMAYLQSLASERSKNRKKGILLIVLGAILVGVLGTITDVIMPLFGVRMPLADVLTIIETGLMAIAMVRYKVFAIGMNVPDRGPVAKEHKLQGPYIVVPTTEKDEHFELFNEYLRLGKRGMIITTTPPDEVSPHLDDPKAPIIWLTEKETKQAHFDPSQLNEIYDTIALLLTKSKGGVILFDLYDGFFDKLITTYDFVWNMVSYFKVLEAMLRANKATILIARRETKNSSPLSYSSYQGLLSNSNILLGSLQRYGFADTVMNSLKEDERSNFKFKFEELVEKKYQLDLGSSGWEVIGPPPTGRNDLVSLLRSLHSALRFVKRNDLGDLVLSLGRRIGIMDSELLLHPGGAYLLSGKDPAKAFQFLHHFSGLSPCLCIIKTSPDRIRRDHRIHKDCRLVWITEQAIGKRPDPAVETIKPGLEYILLCTEKFLEENPKGVVLIEGLDYFITHVEFDALLRLLEKIADKVWMTKGMLLIPIDPAILDEKQHALLERLLEAI